MTRNRKKIDEYKGLAVAQAKAKACHRQPIFKIINYGDISVVWRELFCRSWVKRYNM